MITIDNKLLSNLSNKAKKVERRRINYNFHAEFSDPINRLLNAIEPGSYIRPHKHESPDKREVFIILKGRVAVIEFEEDGNIKDHKILDPSKSVFGVEIPARVWHSIISLEKGSVIYEIKDGPYKPVDDKNFAVWAPVEKSVDTLEYLNNIIEKLHLQ